MSDDLFIVAQVEQQAADTIYTNGKVYTVEQDNPWAEAFAVKNGRFVALGKTAALELLNLSKIDIFDQKS